MAWHPRPSGKLRAVWKNVPEELIPKVEKPTHIGYDDAQENYLYRLEDDKYGRENPVDLLHRVRSGVKPVGTLLLRCQRTMLIGERSVVDTSERLGLECQIFFVKGGKRKAVFYQPGVTLAQYYDPAKMIASYAAVGISLDKELFNMTLDKFARCLAHEDFPSPVKYPLMGMCFGYPLDETLDVLKC
jgi:hypothetical protein